MRLPRINPTGRSNNTTHCLCGPPVASAGAPGVSPGAPTPEGRCRATEQRLHPSQKPQCPSALRPDRQAVNDLLAECPAHPGKRTEALKRYFQEVRELTTEQTGPRCLVYAGITEAMFGVNGGRVQGHPIHTDNPWVQHSGLPATGQPASDSSHDSPSLLRVTLLRPTMKTPQSRASPPRQSQEPPTRPTSTPVS